MKKSILNLSQDWHSNRWSSLVFDSCKSDISFHMVSDVRHFLINCLNLFIFLSQLLLFCEGLDRFCLILNGPGSSTKDYKINFCKLNKIPVIASCCIFVLRHFCCYFYSGTRHLIFKKNDCKPRNIKYGFDQQGWYGMFVACGIWCLADVSSVSPSSEQTGELWANQCLNSW